MTPDTSVVAAAGEWHPRNVAAFTAVEAFEDLVDHVELEAYSVLTRIPEPFRALPQHVAEHLDGEYPGERLGLAHDDRRRLLTRLSQAGVSGGAVYDALAAATAAEHGRTLLTLEPPFTSLAGGRPRVAVSRRRRRRAHRRRPRGGAEHAAAGGRGVALPTPTASRA